MSSVSLPNIPDHVFRDAVRHFWKVRSQQGVSQTQRGTSDQGNRSNVTGGRQLDGFHATISAFLQQVGVPASEIFTKKGQIVLPGYYRATKQWDLIVVRDGECRVAIEFKSQVGSFGNNLNNRTEEALGNAEDLWTAYREGLLGPTAPFTGFLYLLEKAPESLRPIRVDEPHYRVDPVFNEASYASRLVTLCRRLVAERKYSAACPLIVRDPRAAIPTGEYEELDPDMHGARRFLTEMLRAVVSTDR